MSAPFIFINNEFVKEKDATLHISDLTIQRGYGIFDFLKTIEGAPVFMEDHLDRFYNSARNMRLAVPLTKNHLKEVIFELIRLNNMPTSGIRFTLTGGYSEDGYQLATPNLIITQQPLKLTTPLNQKGYRLITYNHQREMPDVKTINYTMGIWLQHLIKEKRADDVLYCKNGLVTECPRANFFIVTQHHTLVTPANNILKGVIRKKVIELAKPHFKLEERDITLTEVQAAREAFITSTTKQILPVVQIDHFIIGNTTANVVTRQLQELLAAATSAATSYKIF